MLAKMQKQCHVICACFGKFSGKHLILFVCVCVCVCVCVRACACACVCVFVYIVDHPQVLIALVHVGDSCISMLHVCKPKTVC